MSDNNSDETNSTTNKLLISSMTNNKAVSVKEEMSRFAVEIASLMTQLQITAMEAIVHYSQKNGIEIEVVAKLINKDLKDVLKDEAAALNFLRYKNGKVIRPRKNAAKQITSKSRARRKGKKK
jgi:hypothetical protein